MSEAQPGGFKPETGSDFFSIEGDGRRFFLDEGEKLTENPEGIREFGGFINFRDTDGKEQKFPGGVVDGGDHWLVQRYDDKGDSEYRIPKSGVVPEAGRVVAEGIVPVAEAPVGGLEDAAALAAMEAAPAPAEQATPALEPQAAPETVVEVKEVTESLAEAPEAPGVAPQPPVLEPGLVSEPAPQPEATAVPVEIGQRPTIAEARQQFDREFRDSDARARQVRYDAQQKNSLQQQAQELRAEAEKARSRVNKLRNKDRIAEAFSEEGRLVAEAKRLEGQAAAINALEDADIRAIEDRRQRARDLTQEVERWGNLMDNPALIEEYRDLDGRMQEDLAAADRLFGGGNPEDQRVLDPARKRIEGRTQARRAELQAMFPRRFMELAGMTPRQDLGEAEIDFTTLDRDLIERYYQMADQFYAELTGQPQAVQPEMPEAPGVMFVPEPVAPPEPVIEPVIEPTAEPTVEATEAMPTEMPGPGVAVHPEEVTVPPIPIEEVAPVPIEASVEGSIPGQVVTDAEEQARATAARPAGAGVAQTPEQVGEEIERIRMEMTPPPEEAVEAPALAEAAAETLGQIQERAERRRNNFDDAVAQLEGAYIDNSGTQAERVGRVVKRVRGMILAGLELAEEGGAAQEVVMTVLGKLNNEQNRRLVQAAVGQAPEQVEQAVGNTLRARGAFGPDGKPKSRKELEDAGLVGLIELLLQLGMSFTDASINAVITEVQSATGAGR